MAFEHFGAKAPLITNLEEHSMVILGIILLIVGLLVDSLSILVTIGAILIVVGIILNLVPIGGTRRRVY